MNKETIVQEYESSCGRQAKENGFTTFLMNKLLALINGQTNAKVEKILDRVIAVEDEYKAIHDGLSKARDFNLECEVVWAALQAMKKNPALSIETAMEIGCSEWDV